MLKYTLDPDVSLKHEFWKNMENVQKNVVGNRNHKNGKNSNKKFKKVVFMPRKRDQDSQHSNNNRKLIANKDGGNEGNQENQNEMKVTTSSIREYISNNSTLSNMISKSLELEIHIYNIAVEINRKQCVALNVPDIGCIL